MNLFNYIIRLLGTIAVLKRRDMVLNIHTKFDFLNIVEMGEGETFFIIFPKGLTIHMAAMATILSEW